MNKVGNLLREQRQAKDLSTEDVVKATKVQKIYIDAIENGDFAFFKNQEFYQQVFVGSYADFLGLNKNEVLSGLQEDIKEYQDAPKVSKVAPTPMTSEVVQEYLNDKDLASSAENEPEKIEEVPEVEKIENTNIVQPSVENTNEEINQLIDEINENIDVDMSDYFQPIDEKSKDVASTEENMIEKSDVLVEEVEKVDEAVADNSLLNSSIFEDIQKINEETEEIAVAQQAEKEVDVAPIALEGVTTDFFGDVDKVGKANNFETTAVIDLTNGIEIETVSDEVAKPIEPLRSTEDEVVEPIESMESIRPTEDEVAKPIESIEPINEALEPIVDNNETASDENVSVLEPIEKQLDGAEKKPEYEVEEINKEGNNILKDLEKTLDSSNELKSLSADPEKTSMDLKIAKALGDSKIEPDAKDIKKIKRDRIIDYILIIAIILLLVYFAYLVWQHIS